MTTGCLLAIDAREGKCQFSISVDNYERVPSGKAKRPDQESGRKASRQADKWTNKTGGEMFPSPVVQGVLFMRCAGSSQLRQERVSPSLAAVLEKIALPHADYVVGRLADQQLKRATTTGSKYSS